jgi:hypothetical protein
MSERSGEVAERTTRMDPGTERAIIETVNGYVMAADAKDWTACRSFFNETVELEHDADASQGRVSADDMIAGWIGAFAGFRSTLHVVTNHTVQLVAADRAVCRSYVQAMHVGRAADAAGYLLTFGTYEHRLVRTAGGWHIDRIVYREVHALGDRSLFGRQGGQS